MAEIWEEVKRWLPIFFFLGLGYLVWRYVIPPPKVKPLARMVPAVGKEFPLEVGIPAELEVDTRYFLGFGLMNLSTIDEKPHRTSFSIEAEIHIPLPLGPDWRKRWTHITPELGYREIHDHYFEFTIPEMYLFRSMVGRGGTITIKAFVAGEFAGETKGSFITVSSPVLTLK